MKYQLSRHDIDWVRERYDRAVALRHEAAIRIAHAELLEKHIAKVVTDDMERRGLTGSASVDAISGAYQVADVVPEAAAADDDEP
jgi:hypothetical protein